MLRGVRHADVVAARGGRSEAGAHNFGYSIFRRRVVHSNMPKSHSLRVATLPEQSKTVPAHAAAAASTRTAKGCYTAGEIAAGTSASCTACTGCTGCIVAKSGDED